MKTTLLSVFLLWSSLLAAQASGSPQTLTIRKTDKAIVLDGALDDAAWQNAQVATDFRRQFPVDTGLATARTEIRLCFDGEFLYVGAVCWQAREDYTVQSLKRDFVSGTSDALNVLIDPYKDGLNGFFFGVNPLNVQREALIDNGQTFSFEWDNRWNSAIQNLPDRWVVEMAIPFKTLRYKVAEGENSWRINFVRTRLKNWEVSSWQPVPQQFVPNNIAFAGPLLWESPPPKPGANVALIPYVSGRTDINYLRDDNTRELIKKNTSGDLAAGGDAKIGLTPSLNLDLTFNPDFSQVEVDRQVTNLSRFELFFPERRQFFLENRDLFAMFGFPGTRPFFSRRIGLGYNPVKGSTETVPIVAGARLSGKINDEWRVGLLNMQTARVKWDTAQALPAANFTVATVQKKVFGRSAVSAILVNKLNVLHPLTETQKAGYEPWNRVAGLEYNLYSRDNRWEGEWYYHRSFSPDPQKRGQTLAHFLGFSDRHFNSRLGYVLVDSTYNSEAGFVPRVGYQSFFPGAGLTFYPKHPWINTWEIDVNGDLTYSLGFKETDRDVGISIGFETKQQASLYLGLYNEYTYLFEPFDPSNQDAEPLPTGGYSYSSVSIDGATSQSHDLQASLSLAAGEFFNGSIFNADGELVYRLQPYGTVAVTYSYNLIKLPRPYASADLWLVGARTELAFTRNLFASAFLQWNTQDNNFNINTRIQWRFAPVSDVFLVYTDNSFAQQIEHTPVRFFTPKNRALVVKVVYWLNV